ncbi:MAG TPA: hypothetical protein VF062_05095 [Candidatus Limnocylindrales bacterium]
MKPVGGEAYVRAGADYKSLIDRTWAIIVDDWLCLYGPDNDVSYSNIASLVAEREDAWVQFRAARGGRG